MLTKNKDLPFVCTKAERNNIIYLLKALKSAK
jgi:hypothetical protein